MQTKPVVHRRGDLSSSNDSWAITWHQWHAAYPIDSRIGTSRARRLGQRRRASTAASAPGCRRAGAGRGWWPRRGSLAAVRLTPAAPRSVRRRLTDRALVGGLVRLGVLRSNDFGQLAQLPVHRPHQQERADQQQHDDDEAERAGLAEVRAGVAGRIVGQQTDRRSSSCRSPVTSRSPRTGRSPGSDTGTRDRASSYSSVGQILCCHSIGARKKRRSGRSGWRARAARRRAARSTRRTRSRWSPAARTGRCSGSQCLSHFANGPSSPCLSNSSWNSCMRFRMNPWL